MFLTLTKSERLKCLIRVNGLRPNIVTIKYWGMVYSSLEVVSTVLYDMGY